MSRAGINHYVEEPEQFRKLTLEEQLAVLADIILYCTEAEIQVLREGHKERSVEFREAHAKTKYWENLQMNIKKLADLEAASIRKGY